MVTKEVFLCVQNSSGMIEVTMYGDCWSHTFPGSEDSGAESHRITGG